MEETHLERAPRGRVDTSWKRTRRCSPGSSRTTARHVTPRGRESGRRWVLTVEPIQQVRRSQMLGACLVVGELALGEHLSGSAGRTAAKEPRGGLEDSCGVGGQLVGTSSHPVSYT